MSRPGLEPGPPAWEASTLEKSHLDSLYAGYSEPLHMMRLAPFYPDLYSSYKNFYCTCYNMVSSESQQQHPDPNIKHFLHLRILLFT